MINAQRQRQLHIDRLSQFDPAVFGERTTNPPPDLARLDQARKRPQILVRADGATAENGGHVVHFDGNLNRADAVTLIMPDGKRLQGHVTAIALSDGHGQRIWLGHVKNCVGEADEAKAEVIYREAFQGVRADVKYVYGLNFLEQLVVFNCR